jgi:hypothetical protein
MSAPINLSRTAREVLSAMQAALAEFGLMGQLVSGGKHHKLVVRLPRRCARPVHIFGVPCSPSDTDTARIKAGEVRRRMRELGVARLQQQPRRSMSS